MSGYGFIGWFCRGCGLLLLGLAMGRAASEDVVTASVREARADVARSVEELNVLRDRIVSERVPLARKAERLEAEAASLRDEVRRLRALRSREQSRRADLRADVEQLKQELDFVGTVFREYRRGVDTRATVAESMYVAEHFPETFDGEAPAASAEALMTAGWEWHEARMGGYVFSGEALDGSGRVHEGRFAQVGPLGYFSAEEGTPAGWVRTEAGSVLPGLYVFGDPAVREAISRLARGEEAQVPVDVSGGDALKVEEAQPTLMEHLRQGGAVVVPLLIVGALSLVMVLVKLIDLARLKVRPDPEMLDALGHLDDETASDVLEWAERRPEPIGSVMAAAVRHRRASREHLEEILHEHVLGVVPRLERSLGMLAVFGGIAPLLGLLGTVTGMIHTFQLVQVFGTGNSRTLSGGISEALVTTQVGLIIAIPVLLAHAFLARRARALLGELEQSAVSLVNEVKSDPADQ